MEEPISDFVWLMPEYHVPDIHYFGIFNAAINRSGDCVKNAEIGPLNLKALNP